MINCYNIGAKYEIIGRVSHGTSVVAYMVKDRANGTISKIEKGIIEQLALNKQVYNCQAQIYNDRVNMKGINCKISKLPKYDDNGNPIIIEETTKPKVVADLKLIGKVQSGRAISDYVVISLLEPTKKMKVPKETVLQLALEGRVTNAKVQMNNGDMILRGSTGESLSQLALYRV